MLINLNPAVLQSNIHQSDNVETVSLIKYVSTKLKGRLQYGYASVTGLSDNELHNVTKLSSHGHIPCTRGLLSLPYAE